MMRLLRRILARRRILQQHGGEFWVCAVCERIRRGVPAEHNGNKQPVCYDCIH